MDHEKINSNSFQSCARLWSFCRVNLFAANGSIDCQGQTNKKISFSCFSFYTNLGSFADFLREKIDFSPA